ncbi:MAG: methyltransferase domain-containing protein [Planctomycetes bacterium]|nr:methyltransferase domain-containing protein [Planctomycetota bacterium]
MTISTRQAELVRLEAHEQPIYVWPNKPDWCVPNGRADFLMQRIVDGGDPEKIACDYARHYHVSELEAWSHLRRIEGQIESETPPPYTGRADCLSLKRLRECWFHLTNRCNAQCRHCMFSCSPETGEELAPQRAEKLIDEALELGTEVFYFTGGEPFVYDGVYSLWEKILNARNAHVVILTNAIGASRFLQPMEGWDRERVHFQVSLDGMQNNHDAVRGKGSFQRVCSNVQEITAAGFPTTIAMSVQRRNLEDMSNVVAKGADLGVHNVHFMWLFTRGEAGPDLFVEPEEIFPELVEAARAGEREDVLVDNLEILKSQVFSIPGSRFDLSNAGWESLTVGPDAAVYPSPALVNEERAVCGDARDGLERVWRESKRLTELRESSLVDCERYRDDPFGLILGGGDIDHSLSHGGTFVGADPYMPLYRKIVQWLIAEEAEKFPEQDSPGFRLRMGEWLHECGESDTGVLFTHSNCVLSLPGKDGHTLARDFYSVAAEKPNEEILNPAQYDEGNISFVPEEARLRSYGCGSPVDDADLEEGQTVLDLGCGAGMECFVASSRVGSEGRVIGVDMLSEMLQRAEDAATEVAENLGYDNVEFRRGFLEELPLEDDTVDVVISNCVINLSPHKRRVFREIVRVLKPGGKLVISDVTSEDAIPIEIKYSEKLRGECLGGALRQERLFQLLADVGLRNATVLKRFPYRNVRGHQFHSITYAAVKPKAAEEQKLFYRGPFAAVVTDDGHVLERGRVTEVVWQDGLGDDTSVFTLGEEGEVTNLEQESRCACFAGPEDQAGADTHTVPKLSSGCMVCGAPLEYLDRNRDEECYFCGETHPANAVCEGDHFVCDSCHREDALKVIERICLRSDETDLIVLFKKIRRHSALPVHGPEHHSLVPAVIVTAFRNAGGRIDDGDIRTAVERGATIAGGACAFLGACGGATGAAAGMAIILGANPVKGTERQLVQRITMQLLEKISDFEAARCCQRDCWLSLQRVAEISEQMLPLGLTAEAPLECEQYRQNKECIGRKCPLWSEG